VTPPPNIQSLSSTNSPFNSKPKSSGSNKSPEGSDTYDFEARSEIGGASVTDKGSQRSYPSSTMGSASGKAYLSRQKAPVLTTEQQTINSNSDYQNFGNLEKLIFIMISFTK